MLSVGRNRNHETF